MSHSFEGPIVDREEGSPLRNLAEQVADFIAPDRWPKPPPPDQPERGARVIGLFGGRGSGKTSFLYTLFDVLQRRNQSSPARYALPTPERWPDRLLELEHSRDDDDLLFTIVNFLHASYGGSSKDGVAELLGPEVRRRQLPRFLDFVRDTTPRLADLPSALAQEFADQAQATATIRAAVADLIRSRRGDQTLVFLVDDLDLQPRRALDVLLQLRVFFDLPRVAIVVAADRDLLLRRLRDHLSGSTTHLAGALLRKLIPDEFPLPVPPPTRRLREVWGTAEEPAAEPFWSPLTDQRWFEAALAQAMGSHAAEEGPGSAANGGLRVEEKHGPTTSSEAAKEYLKPILPATWRGLLGLRRRLAEVARQYRLEPGVGFGEELDSAAELSLARFAMPPFVSLLLAADTALPELGLFDTLLQAPAALARILGIVGMRGFRPAPDSGEEREPGDEGARALWAVAQALTALGERTRPPPELWEHHEPVLHFLGGLSGGERAAALEALRHLARSWRALQNLGQGAIVVPRFLAVSIDADALGAARAAWEGLVPEELRSHLEIAERDPRTEPDNLRQQRDELRRRLRAVPDRLEQPVWMHLLTPLSLAIWLGWETRYWRVERIYNFDRQTRALTPFFHSSEALAAHGYFYEPKWLEHRPEAEEESGEPRAAIVLVDLLRRSTAEQMNAFFDDGAPVSARHRHRLLGPEGLRLAPQHARQAIQDVVDLLADLRERQGVDRFHLAYVGPAVLAVMLGRHLNEFHPRIYEWTQEEQRYRKILPLED